ncbi:pyridoxal phosphate-dependent aminotransferase [Nocardia tengchongensis]|uniref:pyridoxal phosphate-dependent aminotransferase n=1 Tax=Nocardia tengchongensis TaxID=2055889 RepID=UPI0036887919
MTPPARECPRFPLALNENPYGPLPSVRRALEGALVSANRYPEFWPRRLPRLIANHLGCSSEQIVVGAGATGVIMHILQALLTGPDAEVVMADPTFDGYPLLTVTVGGHPVMVPLTADGSQDLEAMLAAIDARTQIVVLCNPHNPTGTRLRHRDLAGFLNRIDARITVILDEAYIEFMPPHRRTDTDLILAAHPNVIVVRTFSKAFGLAGLRVGYALTNPQTAARIARWQIPFGINALAEIAVHASYAAQGELNHRIRTITRERDRLTAALRRLGYTPPDSAANYVFVPLTDPVQAGRVSEAFAAAGIRAKQYPAGIRITVGDPTANDAVIASLTDAQSGLPVSSCGNALARTTI